VQEKFAEKFPETPVPHRNAESDRPRKLNELKAVITAFIRKLSQEDQHKVFANKINGFRPV
jgi:hypothetical protein